MCNRQCDVSLLETYLFTLQIDDDNRCRCCLNHLLCVNSPLAYSGFGLANAQSVDY